MRSPSATAAVVEAPLPDSELLSQIVQVIADAVVSEDLDGTITSWNAAAERLYGGPARDLVGTPAVRLHPERHGTELAGARGRALAGERVEHFDTWHRRLDGRLVAVSLAVSALRDPAGTVVGLVSTTQDVTARLRLDAELEDARRTADQSNDALRRSNRDLEQFAYVASHDLSEPLRVMTGYVQLIEKRYAAALDERGRRYVFHVVDGSARMRTLIDDLLEYSRFLRRSAEPGVVDCSAVAAEVVRRLREQIQRSGADVRVADLPCVRSDESSVTAVLQNLLSNALKFARPGEPPRVVVGAQRQGGSVVLTVDDAGIGIDPEYRDRVFRMFSRLHVREDYEGTGIGLAIVQQVAESHGGRAWVEPSALGGCRFCVSLPAAAAATPAPAGRVDERAAR